MTCLLTNPFLYAVESYTYTFDGPTGCGAECFDPDTFRVEFSGPGATGEHDGSGHWCLCSSEPFNFSNLYYDIGPGNFSLELELDNLVVSGNSDNQIHFIDPDAVSEGSNAIFIVQFIFLDGTLNLNALAFPTFGGDGSAALGTDTTSLNIKILYVDDLAVDGGTWNVEYDKNDTGYVPLATFNAADHPYDAALDRYFKFWIATIDQGAYVCVCIDRFINRPRFK